LTRPTPEKDVSEARQGFATFSNAIKYRLNRVVIPLGCASADSGARRGSESLDPQQRQIVRGIARTASPTLRERNQCHVSPSASAPETACALMTIVAPSPTANRPGRTRACAF
jgi:hypothetical protein